MHVNTYPFGGTAFTGDGDNNSGFSWSYQDTRSVIGQGERRFEVQSMFAGQITQPVPAVTDDFGTLVVVQS